jgi:hypothetical protein
LTAGHPRAPQRVTSGRPEIEVVARTARDLRIRGY